MSAIARARSASEWHEGLLQTLIGLEMETEAMRRQAAAEGPASEARFARLQQLLRAEIHRGTHDRFEAVISDGPPVAATAPTRIVIAEDHPIFRAGLVNLIGTEPGFQLAGEARDGDEALRLVSTLHPDVLVLDLTLPGVPGMEVLAELHENASPVRTIVLAADIEREEIVKALQVGAKGVVLKQDATRFLFTGIRAVVAGQHWIERHAVSNLVEALGPQDGSQSPAAFVPSVALTAREGEVIALIRAGCTNRAIAERFSISEHTVKHHLTNIFDKVGVSNRLELALFAVHHGLPIVQTSPDQVCIRTAAPARDRSVTHDERATRRRSSGTGARRQRS